MIVIDHEPQFWFLLQIADGLLLDVNCSHDAVGYRFMIQLNDDELRAYRAGGRGYLCDLAETIDFSAPGVKGSSSPYKDRNVDRLHSDAVMEAIQAWRSSCAAG
ncbi:MAG: hypothetical protein ACN6PJ_01050 [Achromobacter sp.]|uniref:hypothetical protein n=1 Tax=Achromobacter sp. TaxID=134375 RepID=UPI003CFC1201